MFVSTRNGYFCFAISVHPALPITSSLMTLEHQFRSEVPVSCSMEPFSGSYHTFSGCANTRLVVCEPTMYSGDSSHLRSRILQLMSSMPVGTPSTHTLSPSTK